MKLSLISVFTWILIFLVHSPISAATDTTYYITALSEYEKKEYKSVIEILEKINLNNISDDLRRDVLWLSGMNLYKLRQYNPAIEKIEKAISYDKEGIANIDTRNMNNMKLIGRIYHNSGKNKMSIEYFERAISMLDVIDESDYDNYIDILTYIAKGYSFLGQFEKADYYFQQVYDYILNCKSDYDYKLYCKTLVRESTHNIRADDYEKAEAIIEQVSKIYAENKDTDSHYYFEHLAKKASFCKTRKNYEEATRLYLKILSEKKYNKQSTTLAWDLRRIGGSYLGAKDYTKSKEYYEKSIQVYENIGSISRQYVKTLDQYSELLFYMDYREEAITLKEKCLKYQMESLKVDDTHVQRNHKTLAWMYRNTNRLDEALKHYKICINILEKIYVDDHNSLHNTFDDIALTLLKLGKHNEADHYYTRYYEALKPRIKEHINHLSDEDFMNVNSFYEDEIDEIKYLTHHSAYDKNKWSKNVYNILLLFRTILLEDKNQITKAINQNNELNSILDITYEDIQAELSPNEIAIEFYDYRDRVEDCTIISGLCLDMKSNGPMLVPLFEIDDFGNKYGVTENKDLLENQSFKNEVSRILNQHFSKRNAKVYYSLSKSLYKMKFDLSNFTNGEKEIEYHQLFSTRNILKLKKKYKELDKKLLALGNITFDTIANKSTKIWNELKYTEMEIELMNDYCMTSNKCQISSLTKKEAEEEVIYQILKANDINILHFATHGFFNERIDTTNNSNHDGIHFRYSKNPLKRCGVLLTNGNHTWQSNSTYENGYDGILTGNEISNIDLSNTNLVVLSSCDSGIGEINENEGVFGLQRAFKLAGVRNLIVSVDKVSDLNSMKFMNYFYEQLLVNNKNIHDSFYTAKDNLAENVTDPKKIPKFILIES